MKLPAYCIDFWRHFCSCAFSSNLTGLLDLLVTKKRYTPALPFTGWAENTPFLVTETAPERAGSLAPAEATNTGAAKVIWLTTETLAPLDLAAAIFLTPFSLASIISAFLSLITSALTISLTWGSSKPRKPIRLILSSTTTKRWSLLPHSYIGDTEPSLASKIHLRASRVEWMFAT